LLNNKLKGSSFFRTAYFMPNVLDTLVVGIIWIFIYMPGGPLDRLLSAIGLPFFSQTGFLGNPYTAMPAVVMAMVLKSAGFGMILFLAAIQNINESVYEAADIDGASRWQQTFLITLPLVKPIILFMSVIGIISALNAFAEIYAMTAGGPYYSVGDHALGSTNLSGYYLYRTFEGARYGYAAAISYILLVITLIISAINMKFLGKQD
jgi:ABC-type sugar transport system permease subunit